MTTTSTPPIAEDSSSYDKGKEIKNHNQSGVEETTTKSSENMKVAICQTLDDDDHLDDDNDDDNHPHHGDSLKENDNVGVKRTERIQQLLSRDSPPTSSTVATVLLPKPENDSSTTADGKNNHQIPSWSKEEEDSNDSDSDEKDQSTPVTPTDNDVLCGRGRAHFCHPANRNFREVVGHHVAEYGANSHRRDRSRLIHEIVRDFMRKKVRFLKYDKAQDYWYDAGWSAAKDKVSHGLRDALSTKNKSIAYIHYKHEETKLQAALEQEQQAHQQEEHLQQEGGQQKNDQQKEQQTQVQEELELARQQLHLRNNQELDLNQGQQHHLVQPQQQLLQQGLVRDPYEMHVPTGPPLVATNNLFALPSFVTVVGTSVAAPPLNAEVGTTSLAEIQQREHHLQQELIASIVLSNYNRYHQQLLEQQLMLCDSHLAHAVFDHNLGSPGGTTQLREINDDEYPQHLPHHYQEGQPQPLPNTAYSTRVTTSATPVHLENLPNDNKIPGDTSAISTSKDDTQEGASMQATTQMSKGDPSSRQENRNHEKDLDGWSLEDNLGSCTTESQRDRDDLIESDSIFDHERDHHDDGAPSSCAPSVAQLQLQTIGSANLDCRTEDEDAEEESSTSRNPSRSMAKFDVFELDMEDDTESEIEEDEVANVHQEYLRNELHSQGPRVHGRNDPCIEFADSRLEDLVKRKPSPKPGLDDDCAMQQLRRRMVPGASLVDAKTHHDAQDDHTLLVSNIPAKESNREQTTRPNFQELDGREGNRTVPKPNGFAGMVMDSDFSPLDLKPMSQPRKRAKSVPRDHSKQKNALQVRQKRLPLSVNAFEAQHQKRKRTASDPPCDSRKRDGVDGVDDVSEPQGFADIQLDKNATAKRPRRKGPSANRPKKGDRVDEGKQTQERPIGFADIQPDKNVSWSEILRAARGLRAPTSGMTIEDVMAMMDLPPFPGTGEANKGQDSGEGDDANEDRPHGEQPTDEPSEKEGSDEECSDEEKSTEGKLQSE